MKLITFAIPCYNSESYMAHAIDSILLAKEDIEIIIINDGSKDNTKKIAESYRKKYPDIIRVINQENQGHGEGVNQGLKYAEGLYYKVVDSDDWVDEEALNKLIKQIKSFNKKELPDMLIVNYVYERQGKQKVINYKSVLPKNKIFTWDDVGHFKLEQNILMHSVIYKTDVLKNSGVVLPKHTFYVDNIFVYYPLPYIKTMYYMDIDFYRYFIGRSDQSVNEQIMVKRMEQQFFITKEMTKFFDPYSFESKKLTKYLIHYLSMMYSICFILCALANTPSKKEEMLLFLKQSNYKLYKHIKNHSLATLTRLPRVLLLPGYRIVRKIYKFN